MDIIELVGYHGTSRQAAELILTNGFGLSRNKYDWLGIGVYFWQDAPYRAWDWACQRHSNSEPTVICSRISMRRMY